MSAIDLLGLTEHPRGGYVMQPCMAVVLTLPGLWAQDAARLALTSHLP